MRAESTASPVAGSVLGGRAHLTSSLTGVTSQLFGLISLKAPTTAMVLPVKVAGVDVRQHLLLHLVVQRRAGVLIFDLVGELAEGDLAGGVAQIGAVDRRPGLHADRQRVRQTVDGDLVDAGLSLADDAGELDRE